MPRSVLISDTASAPASCAAWATAGTSVAFGVSLMISGLAVSGLTRSEQARHLSGSAPIIRPVSTFGQETFSSSALTSSRSANAWTASHLVPAEAHHVDDQRDRKLGQLREVVLEVADQALIGQPD